MHKHTCHFRSFLQGHGTYGNVLRIPSKLLTRGSLNGALCPSPSPAAWTPPRLHSSTINPADHMSSPHMFPPKDYLTCGWTKRSDRSWKPRWCICPSCRRTRPCFSTPTSTGESSRVFTSQGPSPCGSIFISQKDSRMNPQHLCMLCTLSCCMLCHQMAPTPDNENVPNVLC